MFAWLKRVFSPALISSPSGADQPVVSLTDDPDRMASLAFVRTATRLQDETELVAQLRRLQERDVMREIKALANGNPNFDGFDELYQMSAEGFRVQWHKPRSYSVLYTGHDYLARRIAALNRVAPSEAVLAIGSNSAEENYAAKGYPVSGPHADVFAASYLFLPVEEFASLGLPTYERNEIFVQRLKDLSGTFEYKNRIIIIRDGKQALMNVFIDMRTGHRRVGWNDPAYTVSPENIVDVLAPPDEREIAFIDAFVVAYAGQLLRAGYFPGKRGEAPDHSVLSGDGAGRLLDAAYGIKSGWRPFLTRSDQENDPPDVSLSSVADAARALHVVNRLAQAFKQHRLI